jgi:hypothetical protein
MLWLSLMLLLMRLLAFAAARLTPRHTAYLRVAEGCNHACTFCAIPGFRGKFRSKAWGAVLDEAARLVASGVVELNLIAEDTNQYGQDRCAARQVLAADDGVWDDGVWAVGRPSMPGMSELGACSCADYLACLSLHSSHAKDFTAKTGTQEAWSNYVHKTQAILLDIAVSVTANPACCDRPVPCLVQARRARLGAAAA